MSQSEDLSSYSGLSAADFYRLKRTDFVHEFRTFGKVSMLEFSQPAGSYPDPDADTFVLLVPLRSDCRVKYNFGVGKIEQRLVGELSLATPNVVCEYELDADHHVIGIVFPAGDTCALLREINPQFSGHFGKLHATLWRDNAIRDLVLLMWRAAKGDCHAPALDTDSTLLDLATRLLKRADSKFSPKDHTYQLSPHIRRRVIDFIEEHLDEDLPLFRLAEVAELSPFHFSRAFRNDLGDTPHRFVTRCRLRRAEELIRQRSMPLAEVAVASGFSSQSRMNETFARTLGTTPGRMRKEFCK